MDLNSNPKCPLPHIRIADNNHNNRMDADSNHMMPIPKSGNRIMRMRISLITINLYLYLFYVFEMF
jgi:hypothetical protein